LNAGWKKTAYEFCRAWPGGDDFCWFCLLGCSARHSDTLVSRHHDRGDAGIGSSALLAANSTPYHIVIF
jgi:hypothetical protein